MGRIGFGELVVILLVALLLFGAKRLPEIAKSLGESIKEFKKAISDKDSDKSDKKE
jgi:sec-independent protein translocase protein TatA